MRSLQFILLARLATAARAAMLLLLFVLNPGVASCDTMLVSTGLNTGGFAIQQFSLAGQNLGFFTSTGLDNPFGLALDSSGNLFVANVFGNTIREFSPTADDLGIFASDVNEPLGLAFDSSGNLFVANIGDNSIRKFSPTGEDDGIFASLLGIGCPTDLAFDSSGNLLVVDICGSVVWKFSSTGKNLGFFASTGLSAPLGLAFSASGNLFVSNTDQGRGDPLRNTIHEFSPTGEDLGTFASTGLSFPAGLAFDEFGNLYVANESANSIRKFSPTGQDLGDFAVLPDQPRDLVFTTTTVPEPSSLLLLATVVGIALLISRLRRMA